MRAKIIVDLVYVEWGAAFRQTSLMEAVRGIALAGAELNQLVVVDNKHDCVPVGGVGARRVVQVPGNNQAREFSGWDVGYELVRKDGRANVLLFVNDTLGAHRRSRLSRRIRVAQWLKTVGASASAQMFGQLDLFGEAPVPWLFGELDWYISSYLFGISPQGAGRLFPLCQVDGAIETLLQERFSPAGLFTALLPPAFQERINGWLLTPGHWRNAAALTEENFPFFRLKAKSVLYEYALTSRALSAGIQVSDLFDGRNALDRLFGKLTKSWIERTTVSRYRWFTGRSGAVPLAASAGSEQGEDAVPLLDWKLRGGPGH